MFAFSALGDNETLQHRQGHPKVTTIRQSIRHSSRVLAGGVRTCSPQGSRSSPHRAYMCA